MTSISVRRWGISVSRSGEFQRASSVAWPMLLVATDVDSGLAFFVGAAALAAVNTIIGVAVGLASRWLITAIVGQARSHA